MLHHTPGHSPVAYGDCKFTSGETGPLCVDVKFASKEDLDDFITSLIILRDSGETDHSHLQDHRLSPESGAAVEMLFHLPDSCFDDTRDELIATAAKRLKKIHA